MGDGGGAGSKTGALPIPSFPGGSSCLLSEGERPTPVLKGCLCSCILCGRGTPTLARVGFLLLHCEGELPVLQEGW